MQTFDITDAVSSKKTSAARGVMACVGFEGMLLSETEALVQLRSKCVQHTQSVLKRIPHQLPAMTMMTMNLQPSQ